MANLSQFPHAVTLSTVTDKSDPAAITWLASMLPVSASAYDADAEDLSKLREEVQELLDATTPDEVAHEAADVMFFAAVAATRGGADLAAIAAQLDRRARRVRRRPGNAKS